VTSGVLAPARAHAPEPAPATAAPATPEAGERLRLLPETPHEVSPAPEADGTVGAVVETEDGLEVVTVEAAPDELADVEAELERESEVVDVVDVFVDVPARVAASDDSYRANQWNLDDLNVDLLPDGTNDGAGQIVAVVDTGVRASHPDLIGRVDCTLGADFSVTSLRSVGNGCTDPYGHGTHVAGIVSATSGNGIGVAGVSAATIMPVRVLDAEGNGMVSRINAGIIWAVDNGADVINLSLGSDQTTAYDAAVQHALDHDVVVVVAAGNNREEGNTPQSPATVPDVFSVAATDELGLSAPFSYSGPTNFISAPGDYVFSTTPWGYEYASGTSMAAPHVAGIVARYRAINPTADIASIRTAIESTAIDLQQAGFDNETGHGLIDMRELLTGADAPADPARGIVPTAPRITSVTGGEGTLRVEWDAPAWTGSGAITSFDLVYFRLVGDEFVPVAEYNVWDETVRAVTRSGFVNGATYVVLIAANNPGRGQWSLPSEAARPRTKPSAPAIGTPTAGPAAARVRWAVTSTGGAPITSWVVRAYRGDVLVDEVTVAGSARDVRIGGLTNGRAHRFRVQAVNEAGRSPWSEASIAVTPADRPDAPRVAPPSPRDNGAYVTWSKPPNNGATINGFLIKVYQGTRGIKSVSMTGGAINYTVIPGLSPGVAYSFTVTAKNAVGYGPPSARSATVKPY
jgi:subtilisin family serine protease